MDIRLNVLFEKEQVVIDNDGTKNNGITTVKEAEEKYNVKTFIAKLYEEIDNPHDICRAIMEEVSCMEEKIKQKEYILRMMEEKTEEYYVKDSDRCSKDYYDDRKFLTTNHGMMTAEEVEEECNAIAFLIKLKQ